MDLIRHVRTDALDAAKVVLAGMAQPVDGAEITREQLRGRLPDLGYPERIEEPPQLGPSAGSDAVDEVLGRLVGEPLELLDLVHGQAK